MIKESPKKQDKQAIYCIKVEGLLDPCWSEWFAGLKITPQDNHETMLTGPVRDQAALHGLLAKIRDMGLTLLTVERMTSPQLNEHVAED